jgi:hypothetical protein
MRKTAERSSDALDTGFMKAENVVAALVYDEGNGTWWRDIVFAKQRLSSGLCNIIFCTIDL